MLAYVAEQANLSLTWSETPEDPISHDGAHMDLSFTPYATSFRRFFVYHHARKHPHINISLSLFSFPLVLKCVAKILKIGLKKMMSKNVFE